MKLKLAFLVIAPLLLNGCAAVKKQMEGLDALAKSLDGRDKKNFNRKTKETVEHACDLKVTKTQEWADESLKVCTLTVVSAVEGVNVNRKASRFSSAESLWTSAKDTKEIKLKDCDDIEIQLNKRYYDPFLCSANFDEGNAATLELSTDDWIKYGYVRMGYVKGDAKTIEVSGLPNQEIIDLGNTHSQKVELGDYELMLDAPHKVSQKTNVSVTAENDITLISFDTEEANKLSELGEKHFVLTSGNGSLRVVTEKDNAEFEIKRTGETGSSYKAPMLLGLAAGDYVITYNGQSKSFTVKHQKEHEILLGKFINFEE